MRFPRVFIDVRAAMSAVGAVAVVIVGTVVGVGVVGVFASGCGADPAAIAIAAGPGTCQLDRAVGGVDVDASAILDGNDFEVFVDVGNDLGFSCVADQHGTFAAVNVRLAAGEKGTPQVRCRDDGFHLAGVTSSELHLSIANGDGRFAHVFEDVSYVDANADRPAECDDAPAMTATLVWPAG